MSGPRQTIGWPSGTKNWMEINFTPWRSIGSIFPPGLDFGVPVAPSICGRFGPVMSASRSPTRAPLCASATARLTETVLFPTPPLPEATATTFRMFGRSFSWLGAAARRTFAPQRSSVSCTPIPSRAPRMSRSMTSFNGQAGVVSSIIRLALEPLRASSFTISRVTMSLPSSGSCTALSACITVASLISAIHPPIAWSISGPISRSEAR